MQNPARGPWNLVLSMRSFVWAAKEPLRSPAVALRFPLTELSLLEPLEVWNSAIPKPSQTHVSAGEESAREPTCVRQLLGPAESASGRVGMQNPARGPWNLVLSVRSFVWGAKEPLKEPCCCPSLPSDRAFTAEALGSVQPTSP